jgi:hypothetical protein
MCVVEMRRFRKVCFILLHGEGEGRKSRCGAVSTCAYCNDASVSLLERGSLGDVQQ